MSGVLRSPRAVAVNVEIMRAFVRLRRLLAQNAELAKKFDAIKALMQPPAEGPKERIGFVVRRKGKTKSKRQAQTN